MQLNEQIRLHKALSKKISELEEEKKALGIAILQQMQGKIMQVEEFTVRSYSRLSIKLSVEEARALNSVKFEEVVDKEKIKALYHNGQLISGVSEIKYIQIQEK